MILEEKSRNLYRDFVAYENNVISELMSYLLVKLSKEGNSVLLLLFPSYLIGTYSLINLFLNLWVP